LGLVVAGALFAPIAYFLVTSIPLTAVAISAIMIGFTCIALASTRPYISPEASELILKTGMENIATLLEELGLSNKAIYLPSSMREGHPQALIPLSADSDLSHLKGKIPGRLIVRYGDNADDMAIAVTTPGSIHLEKLEQIPAPGSTEIESSITYVLTGLLDLANSVKVNTIESQIHIEVSGAKLHYEDIWYYRCLGSPIASIVATISCETLGKPVRIKEESFSKGKSSIVLEVLA
ncbi:MAG: hypothetical protein PHY28_05605, partial [Dehalococcoidales bacterium]|nr:hypothetical protein [Dehalococcoidales bacterium]